MPQRVKESGVFWMLVSVLSFSLMQLFVTMTSEAVSVYLQIFFRNLAGIFVAGFCIRKEKLSWFGQRREQPYLFGRSIAGFLGLLFFFQASRTADIADATIVNRTGPFFTTLFSALFLREKVTLVQWGALLVVFAGGLISADPAFDSSALPMLYALLSAVANGAAYTLLSYFRNHVPAMTVIMHFSVFSAAASIPFLLGNFSLPSARDGIMLIMIALLGSCGQISITLAYRLAPASEISIFDQLSVVLSVLLGWLFLHQQPTANTFIGGSIVIAASVFIYFYYQRRHAGGSL